MPALRRCGRFCAIALIRAGLLVCFAILPDLPPIHPPAAVAQRVRIEDIWQQVYQQIPDLPLENQYVNTETGEVSTNNTLISRLIRYHIYTKGRPTSYRLDWKLTLADYLDANERMEPATYPSGTALRTNPMEGDKAAIQSLNRAQRDALVNALVSLFNPNPEPEPSSPPPSPAPSSSPSPSPPSRFPRQPQPGDAQLLQP
ncbi:MAG: hypothetical protein EDM05_61185 [Leptolyngbya sp. IPPAS B-1204]|nr:MAG: hypothetical protein EDM05_31465 [Leptolyngbya sp. IPPAS B-1204]